MIVPSCPHLDILNLQTASSDLMYASMDKIKVQGATRVSALLYLSPGCCTAN